MIRKMMQFFLYKMGIVIISIQSLYVLALVCYRQQVWPNQTGPSCIVCQGKWRRWMTRYSTHPAPSSSLRQRIESGPSWSVTWLCNISSYTIRVKFDSYNLYSLSGSDGFSSDWLLSQDPHAQYLISGLKAELYCASCDWYNILYVSYRDIQ